MLGFVALVDGYDGSMTGTLLVLAKKPLHITPGEIRLLAVASSLAACVGGFTAAAISDHWSRRTVMLLGVAAINFFTLLIPLAQSGEQLIIIRLLTGLADRLCRLGAVPDRRRADAGAAPAHLWRNLRDDAGQLVHLGAVGRLSGCRQPERFPAPGCCRPFLGCSSCRCWSIY